MGKMKMIPLELINVLLTNHNGMKKSLMEGTPIKIQQKTKDVLMAIKRANGLSSTSNAIDLLVATVVMYQLNDKDYDGKTMLYEAEQLKDMRSNKGVSRSVIVNGKEFYSVYSVAKAYKISRQTVMYRISNVTSYRFKGWNYAGEDVELKYRDMK